MAEFTLFVIMLVVFTFFFFGRRVRYFKGRKWHWQWEDFPEISPPPQFFSSVNHGSAQYDQPFFFNHKTCDSTVVCYDLLVTLPYLLLMSFSCSNANLTNLTKLDIRVTLSMFFKVTPSKSLIVWKAVTMPWACQINVSQITIHSSRSEKQGDRGATPPPPHRSSA